MDYDHNAFIDLVKKNELDPGEYIDAIELLEASPHGKWEKRSLRSYFDAAYETYNARMAGEG